MRILIPTGQFVFCLEHIEIRKINYLSYNIDHSLLISSISERLELIQYIMTYYLIIMSPICHLCKSEGFLKMHYQ